MRIFFSDGVWTKGQGAGSITLINGSFDGNISLTDTSDTTILILMYPDDVLDVGDSVECSSSQANGQHIVTFGPFSKSVNVLFHYLSNNL